MPADVPRDFTSAGRMTDVDRAFQVEMRRKRSEVVGIVVHVVAVIDLRRTPVTTAIVCDNAKAATKEEHHLGVPVVGRKRPPVAEHDRATRTPIFVVDLYSVGGCNVVHRGVPCSVN
jgi:hypothetical protein